MGPRTPLAQHMQSGTRKCIRMHANQKALGTQCGFTSASDRTCDPEHLCVSGHIQTRRHLGPITGPQVPLTEHVTRSTDVHPGTYKHEDTRDPPKGPRMPLNKQGLTGTLGKSPKATSTLKSQGTIGTQVRAVSQNVAFRLLKIDIKAEI